MLLWLFISHGIVESQLQGASIPIFLHPCWHLFVFHFSKILANLVGGKRHLVVVWLAFPSWQMMWGTIMSANAFPCWPFVYLFCRRVYSWLKTLLIGLWLSFHCFSEYLLCEWTCNSVRPWTGASPRFKSNSLGTTVHHPWMGLSASHPSSLRPDRHAALRVFELLFLW